MGTAVSAAPRASKRLAAWTLSLGVVLASCASAPTGRRQEGRLANNAPADRPLAIAGSSSEEALAEWRRTIAPYVAEARATYPDAKRRYLAGLPQGETFFVTAILRDRTRRFEQVFVLVDRISNGRITGRIWSDLVRVRGYKHGDAYELPEDEIVDWLISKADGSEEGNFVGKYIDRLQDSSAPGKRESI